MKNQNAKLECRNLRYSDVIKNIKVKNKTLSWEKKLIVSQIHLLIINIKLIIINYLI
jgi:hypothetical protein